MTQINTELPVLALVDGIEKLSDIISRATLAGIHRDRTFELITKVVLRRQTNVKYSEPLQAKAESFARWHLSLQKQAEDPSVGACQLWLVFTPVVNGGYVGFKVTQDGALPDGIVIPLLNLCERVQSAYGGNKLLDDYAESLDEIQKMQPELVSQERALLSLLVYERDNLSVGLFDFTQPGADEIFHKQFRQVDVCERSGVDRAIWHLLCVCPIFWGVFKKRAPVLFWPTK